MHHMLKGEEAGTRSSNVNEQGGIHPKEVSLHQPIGKVLLLLFLQLKAPKQLMLMIPQHSVRLEMS